MLDSSNSDAVVVAVVVVTAAVVDTIITVAVVAVVNAVVVVAFQVKFKMMQSFGLRDCHNLRISASCVAEVTLKGRTARSPRTKRVASLSLHLSIEDGVVDVAVVVVVRGKKPAFSSFFRS